MFSCRLLLSVHNVTVRKQTERFLNDFDTGEQTNKQAPQRLNDKRCYLCHAQRVEQSYIDVNGKSGVLNWIHGPSQWLKQWWLWLYCVVPDFCWNRNWWNRFSETLIVVPRTTNIFLRNSCVQDPYPWVSTAVTYSKQQLTKKKLAWMQVWMSYILLLKSTAVYQSI